MSEEKRERLFQELLKYYRIGFVSRRITEIIHAMNTPLQISPDTVRINGT